MKVNYIKVHFLTSSPQLSLINRHFTACNNTRIGVFTQYASIKVTLMGNKFEYVNVTGATSFSYLMEFKNFYISKFKVQLRSEIKIDSICATFRFENKSQVSFEQFRKNLSRFQLNVKDNSKFPGVVIRNKSNTKGGCAIYFRSGSLNFVGFKHAKEIMLMKEKIQRSLF